MTTPVVHNIGPAQRRLRRLSGIGALLLAAALSVAASVIDAGTVWRLLIAPLFFAGFVGVLQARAHTCVALAALGQCDLGSGLERIEEGSRRAGLRAKARKILLQALGATVLVMAAVMLIR